MGIFDIFSAGPGQKAAQDQITAINQGKQDLAQQYGLGRQDITTNYAAALDPWTKQMAYAGRGQDALADALGMNGPEGSARAVAAFQNDPGYNFAMGQGNNAVLANAARTGSLASGNTNIDLTKFAQGLANQQYGNYVNRLQPFLGAGQTAAGGVAGVNMGQGNALAGLDTGLGNALYGADTSIGKAQAGGDLAGYNASGNLWGAGLALAGDVASAMGGGKGGGNLFGAFQKFLPGGGAPQPA
jgi:hypothetical protein